MRASDAERERVAETLREAVAEGRLEMDEFEQRLEATFKARTHGELVPLVRDLPASGGPVAAPKGSSANWPARIGGASTSSGAFAFWGGFSRKGRWTVGPKFTAFAMWGGGEIDLREAHFAERDVVIRCFTIMGGMQVTVPPDLNVQVNGLGVMGGFGEHSKLDDEPEPEPEPDAPRVRITGFALMGGVGVERKRSKAEKRRLQEQERLRLGKPDAGDGRKELG
ncbi:DUF1707 domain-containing protein [[Kitasatospora] papulosa]|uniref:DUF1707 SHOCT-like domain-containing protein n=1 Tax=[Kitasatospora] papulosa TaxID=1464011 RepID=UPI00380E34E4